MTEEKNTKDFFFLKSEKLIDEIHVHVYSNVSRCMYIWERKKERDRCFYKRYIHVHLTDWEKRD